MTTLAPELGHLNDAAVYARLQAAKRAAARDLLRDPATLARGLDPSYRMRPHLKVISDALVDLERGEYDRLLVITPAQVGKSTTTAEWFPFWWLCLHGEDRVAVTSYSDDLALRRGKTIRQYIGEYGGEFGLSLLPGSEAAQDYDTNQGGGVRSVSLGAGLTGFSVNLLVVDDPHKDRAEAESKKMRERVHDWWSSAALKRLQPTATRWWRSRPAGTRTISRAAGWRRTAGWRRAAGGRSSTSRRSPTHRSSGRIRSAGRTATRCRTRRSPRGTGGRCWPGGAT